MNGKNIKKTICSERGIFFTLLGSFYMTTILMIFIEFVRAISFYAGEICAIIINIGIFLTPILLIIFIITIVQNRKVTTNEHKIIGEIPLTFIIISLMILSFLLGIIFNKL